MFCVLLSLLLYMAVSTDGHLYPRPSNLTQKILRDGDDPGTPLFLTPYIENGRIEEARNLSRVYFPGFPDLMSYSGLFTVNKTYGSNQFFWYFPAEKLSAQIIVWLEGGPGYTSLLSLFKDHGPIEVKDGKFQKREMYWSRMYHVIYIDNPVGAGFSFTNNSRGYRINQAQIAEDLYSNLIQFFQLFPHLQKHELFFIGETIAGKYVTALGYAIHKKNPSANIKLNLAGMFVGSCMCDPINQLDFGDYLYQIGLIDMNQKQILEKLEEEVKKKIQVVDWYGSGQLYYDIIGNIQNSMDDVSLGNYMKSDSEDSDYYCDFCDLLEDFSIRRAIHVGDLKFDYISLTANIELRDDIMKSVAPLISELLNHYPMQFYNGQLDIFSAYPFTENFLQNLNFSARDEYLKADREIDTIVYLKDNLWVQTGYTKKAGNLQETLIRDAGGSVFRDQSVWSLAMVMRFLDVNIKNVQF